MKKDDKLPVLEDLEERIEKARKRGEEKSGSGKSSELGVMRVSLELLSGVFVGFAIGYFLDNAFATKPLFLIIFFFLGAAAGFFNIYRMLKKEE